MILVTEFFEVVVLFACVNGFVLDSKTYTGNGESPTFWRTQAKDAITKKAKMTLNKGVAKNVILYLGDGMSIPTITAARILKGQLQGHTGEETKLSFEEFPIAGLSKTYCQDRQVTDSASSATAYLCGVKTNIGTIGVDAGARRGNCASQKGSELTSILDWSMAAGKSVGFVTVTRVTDATPAGLYANVADRSWEGDHYTSRITGGCKDIASQLIDDYKNVQVIMGGGRRFFRRFDQPDPEHGSNAHYGRRDGRDLIQEWKEGQHNLGRTYKYVWNSSDFNSINPATTDSILGLFEYSHMQYELERKDPNHEVAGEPSLAEMTEKAIKILSKNPKGFFLLVEGGNIDHGHHGGRAKMALYDTVAFQDAVAKGASLTMENETLIVVTADHAHTMTMVGYPSRGNNILGKVDDGAGGNTHASDGLPYTTLLYGDGPGFHVSTHGHREDITHVDTTDKHYQQQTAVYKTTETHGGDDVGIFARGPMSYLLTGVHEQNEIAHVMAYSSCVGDYANQNECAASLTG
ncbi:alkaline phosphatase-like [Ruditapes philippinarum]|uniref:alkaline phosphatase-like n=1 Tax=Ruditapes philippinarum TaxID=129788 RepID=UPI00295A9936|nr:alkaline phosphatase-like [Ruditapes philippinarum]